MNPFFKISTFFLPEKSIFSTKTFEKSNNFYKNFVIFSKNYFEISMFMERREISVEFYYLVENSIKNAKNRLDRGGLLVKE